MGSCSWRAPTWPAPTATCPSSTPTSGRRPAEALRATDALVAHLLESVDPEHDSVLVVAPYHRRGIGPPDGRRVAHARRGARVCSGRDRPVAPASSPSSTSRRRSSTWWAWTVRRRWRGVGSSGSPTAPRPARTRAAYLVADRRGRPATAIAWSRRWRSPFVVLQAVLWLGAALALRSGRPSGRRRRWPSRRWRCSPSCPATYLAGLIDFSDAPPIAPTGGSWSRVAIAAGGRRHHARPPHGRSIPCCSCLALVFGLLAVDMLLGAPLQLNTVFGYSPTVGRPVRRDGQPRLRAVRGRRPSCSAASCPGAWPVRSWGTARGVRGARRGDRHRRHADLGVRRRRGAGLRPRRRASPRPGCSATGVRWRSIAVWATRPRSCSVAIFAALDLSRPADRRTHLGRLVEAIADQGVGRLRDGRHAASSAPTSRVITSSIWTAMVPIALGFIVYLLWRAPGHVRSIRDTIRREPAGPGGRRVPRVRVQRLGHRGARRDARRGQRVARVPHRSAPCPRR